MGIRLVRVKKEYKESIGISYNDCDVIKEFLKDIDSDEYQIEFNDTTDYQMEFINSEFNRYCEDKGIDNLPIQIKWLYESITKPADILNGDFIQLEWW